MMILHKLLKYATQKSAPAYQVPIRDPFEERYFDAIPEIEAAWSVLYNLKSYTGPQADAFEQKCLANIQDFMSTPAAWRQGVREVPAYTRLAMLYEKQERYDEAIDICSAAIRNGITIDGSKGQMYGRLARMIRKSGKTVSDDIIKLSQGGQS